MPRPASTRTRRARSPISCGRPRLTMSSARTHLLGPDGALTRMLDSRTLGSLVFWGPPGTGKTTVARLLAQETDLHFEQISAIFSGVADLKKVFEAARARRETGAGHPAVRRRDPSLQPRAAGLLPAGDGRRHHRSRRRDDRKSRRSNSTRALLSRARVLVFKPLDAAGDREAARPRRGARRQAAAARRGSARRADPAWPMATAAPSLDLGGGSLARGAAGRNLRRRQAAGDRAAPRADLRQGPGRPLQSHFSALHKSVRGSDPDAALYYLCRMLDAGEDAALSRAPRSCAWPSRISAWPIRRRWSIANAAKDAFDFLGSPEGELAIAAGGDLCRDRAEIERRLYGLRRRACASPRRRGSLLPPKHILNAPTKLMKSEGYGRGYAYDHDTPEAFPARTIFPKSWHASGSTTRRSAASSARSGSGSTIGPSCAKSGAANDNRSGRLFPARRL